MVPVTKANHRPSGENVGVSGTRPCGRTTWRRARVSPSRTHNAFHRHEGQLAQAAEGSHVDDGLWPGHAPFILRRRERWSVGGVEARPAAGATAAAEGEAHRRRPTFAAGGGFTLPEQRLCVDTDDGRSFEDSHRSAGGAQGTARPPRRHQDSWFTRTGFVSPVRPPVEVGETRRAHRAGREGNDPTDEDARPGLVDVEGVAEVCVAVRGRVRGLLGGAHRRRRREQPAEDTPRPRIDGHDSLGAGRGGCSCGAVKTPMPTSRPSRCRSHVPVPAQTRRVQRDLNGWGQARHAGRQIEDAGGGGSVEGCKRSNDKTARVRRPRQVADALADLCRIWVEGHDSRDGGPTQGRDVDATGRIHEAASPTPLEATNATERPSGLTAGSKPRTTSWIGPPVIGTVKIWSP